MIKTQRDQFKFNVRHTQNQTCISSYIKRTFKSTQAIEGGSNGHQDDSSTILQHVESKEKTKKLDNKLKK